MARFDTTGTGPWVGSPLRTAALGFAAAVLSVLVFHQGTVWLLHMAGYIPNGPYQMRALPPFGVPQIVSQLFWGGLWGVLIALVLRYTRAPALLTGFLIGAVLTGSVALGLVPAIRGTTIFAGGNIWGILRVMLITGAFGWGTALLLTRVFSRA